MDTAAPSVDSPRLLRLAAVIVGIPLAMLVFASFLLVSPLYQRYAEEDWIAGAIDLYTGSHRQCDIVIYGDSTAMIGIDPRIVSGRTHLKTCNIAPNMNSIKLVGLVPLDRYLARNPRPRYLLLQFSPSNMYFHPDPADRSISFEGYVPMLRYGYFAQGIRMILAEPEELIGMMHYVYVNGFINFEANRRNRVSTVQPGAGSYTIMPQPPLSSCLNEREDPIGDRNVRWIKQTRSHYGPMAGALVFDAAPTSPCNHAVDQWNYRLSGLIDNTVEVYATDQFVDVKNHPTREGAIKRSNEVADQILSIENRGQRASAGISH